MKRFTPLLTPQEPPYIPQAWVRQMRETLRQHRFEQDRRRLLAILGRRNEDAQEAAKTFNAWDMEATDE
jgi:hypothetical protein